MLEFDITNNTYVRINERLSTLQQEKHNLKLLRDDIIGNNAIRNAYIQLGLISKLEECHFEDFESFKSLLSLSSFAKDERVHDEIRIVDFKGWLNQITDNLFHFSSSIDGLMVFCNSEPSNIEHLLTSPFLSLCADFFKTSQNYKVTSKLLTFLSYLSFERDFVRKRVVELGILEFAFKLLCHKNDELVLSVCLLLRSVSRSVKLIRTAFDPNIFNGLLEVFIRFSKKTLGPSVDIKRAISAIYCNLAMEHSPFRAVNQFFNYRI